MTTPAHAHLPSCFTLREGEGLRAGAESIIIAGIVAGRVVIESTAAGRIEASAGDTIALGDATVAIVQRLTWDGKRRVRIRVSAPWHVELAVVPRSLPT